MAEAEEADMVVEDKDYGASTLMTLADFFSLGLLFFPPVWWRNSCENNFLRNCIAFPVFSSSQLRSLLWGGGLE